MSNDMRTDSDAAADGNERAQLALNVFVHRLSKAIAGLVVGLQRIDALVFTGGIGENSALVRSLVLSRLGFLGLAEDADANAAHGRLTGGRISPAGPVVALVVPTDEELLIARDTARVIAGDGTAGIITDVITDVITGVITGGRRTSDRAKGLQPWPGPCWSFPQRLALAWPGPASGWCGPSTGGA
jgi:hypothetical protein